MFPVSTLFFPGTDVDITRTGSLPEYLPSAVQKLLLSSQHFINIAH